MRNSAKRCLSFLGIWEGFGRSKAWFVVRLECFRVLLFLFLQVLSRYVSLEAQTAASLVGENNFWKGLGNRKEQRRILTRFPFSHSHPPHILSLILFCALCSTYFVLRRKLGGLGIWNFFRAPYLHICIFARNSLPSFEPWTGLPGYSKFVSLLIESQHIFKCR